MKKLFISMMLVFGVAASSLAVPIAEIQMMDPQPEDGTVFDVEGCVTAIRTEYGGGFWLQDDMAPYSGILIWGDYVGIEIGMHVQVIGGTYLDYYGYSELEIIDVPTNVIIVDTECWITPMEVPIYEAYTTPYESMLVSFLDVICVDPDLGYGEWMFEGDTGAGIVDDLFLLDGFMPTLDECYNLTGIMYYSYGAFKLCPRTYEDIEALGCTQTVIEPTQYSLSANYPNPFNPTTTIDFSLAEPGAVSLTVYNMMGHQVTTLVEGDLTAGSHSVVFDATNLSSGIYFYMIEAGDFVDTRKMVLVK